MSFRKWTCKEEELIETIEAEQVIFLEPARTSLGESTCFIAGLQKMKEWKSVDLVGGKSEIEE